MSGSSGLSLVPYASLPAGLLTAIAARWLDRHLDVLLDHGVWAAIGAPADRGAPSSRNPALDLGAMLLMGLVAVSAESAGQMAAGMLLSSALLLCAWIDWRNRILPDVVILPLLALGFLAAMRWQPFVGTEQAVGGALLGGGMAWMVRILGRSMGIGDIKLLAAVGAWLGPMAATIVFLTSSIFMLIYFVFTKKWRKSGHSCFGPAVAAGSVLYLLFIFSF